MAVEPIEKKPFFHFKPGTKVLSVGGYGCNLDCDFCNTREISQKHDPDGCKYFSPSAIVHLAVAKGCSTVCMDYSEPIVFYEFLIDLANKCHDRGIFFAINTNAYVNDNIWENILDVTDALNIDWKGKSCVYHNRCKSDQSRPIPISNRIERSIKNNNHVEISIPVYRDSVEDDFKDLLFIDIFNNGKSDIPVHVLKILLVDENNSIAKDNAVFNIAQFLKSNGFNFVYVHNIYSEKAKNMRSTTCPNCGLVVATRDPFKFEIREGCKCNQSIFK